MAKRDAQILDEALAAQAAGTYTDPVADAKRLLASLDDRDRMDAIRAENAKNVIRPSTGMERMRGSIDNVLDQIAVFQKPHEAVSPNAKSMADVAGMAALPAAFMTGVPGAAAATYYGLQGLYNATDLNASMAERGMALLPAALPVAGKVGRAMMGPGDEIAAAARAAKQPRVFTADDVLQGGGQFDDVAARQPVGQTPPHVYDMTGSGSQGRWTQNTGMPEHIDTGRLGGRGPSTEGVIDDALFSTANTPSPQDLADDLAAAIERRNPGPQVDFPERMRGVRQNMNSFTTQMPQVVDDAVAAQTTPGMGDVEASLEGLTRSLGEVPTSRGVQAAQRRASQRSVREARLNKMTDDAIAQYRQQQQHGMGGFSGLPELSLGELARITANMRRITGD